MPLAPEAERLEIGDFIQLSGSSTSPAGMIS
jgi:hypothetical protein